MLPMNSLQFPKSPFECLAVSMKLRLNASQFP
jgi:hypothetical protein